VAAHLFLQITFVIQTSPFSRQLNAVSRACLTHVTSRNLIACAGRKCYLGWYLPALM